MEKKLTNSSPFRESVDKHSIYPPPWPPRSHLTHLTLNRFTHPQVELLITQAMHGKSLPPEVVQQVVSKTDGVLLFVEELLKLILESGLVREEEERWV